MDGGEASLFFTEGNGLGIQASSSGGSGSSQIDAAQNEMLTITFPEPVTVAAVTTKPINGGEAGYWKAYDAEGNLVAEGSFSATDNPASEAFEIDPPGDASFSRLEITVVDDGQGAAERFSVEDIGWVPATGPVELPPATFDYTVSDPEGLVSDHATVVITVGPAPTPSVPIYDVTVAEPEIGRAQV